MRRVLVLLGLLSVAAVARAEDDSAARADAAVRERITRERADVQAGFARRQRECAERFAVTACIDAARSEQRAALARLRDQELGLDEAFRSAVCLVEWPERLQGVLGAPGLEVQLQPDGAGGRVAILRAGPEWEDRIVAI